MAKSTDQMLSHEQYGIAADRLHVLSSILLREFARIDAAPRDQIARNFIARADTMVHGIFRLWEINDQADCWILHRALLDRLFHLHDLNHKNQFELFSEWSFKTLYEAADRLRSDPELRGQIDGLVEDLTPEQKSRYGQLVKNPPNWRRPKAEDTARSMGLTFLYRYGYDYASRHVHPMANDGSIDFQIITCPEQRLQHTSGDIAVLSNSILIASMILQEALNASSFSWMAVVYDAVDGLRSSLHVAEPEPHLSLAKVADLFENKVPLARQTTQNEKSF